MTKLMVDTRPLKFVVKKLPLTSATRSEILSEPDNIPSNEYITLVKVWLTLLRFDTQMSKQNEGNGA